MLEELIRAQYARGGDRGRALELANTRLQIDLATNVGAWRKASVAAASSSESGAIQPT